MQTGLGLLNKGHYQSLTAEKLDMFRRAFNDLQVCIIDEISMCGADKLYDIHRRICEILISEMLFANIAILIVGDLMQVRGQFLYIIILCIQHSLSFFCVLAATSESKISV